MKKLTAMILAVCVVLVLSASLTSCLHKCEFSDEWSRDAVHHWHECGGKECEEISDKATHTWDDGIVTSEATQEADGVKTYTCTVCAQTMTEEVVFTGLTEEEWNAAFDESVFKNFSYNEVVNTATTGFSMIMEATMKFTEDVAWMQVTAAGQSEEDYFTKKTEVKELREQTVESFLAMTSYDSFEYDAETKSYKATKEVEVSSLGKSTKNVTLKFDKDGRLTEASYWGTYVEQGVTLDVSGTITLSDYGTVVLDPNS